MSKTLVSKVVMENPEGIEVMGINSDGHLFYGTTTGDFHHDESEELARLSINGRLLHNGKVISFDDEPIHISELRHFNEDIFSKLYLLAHNKYNAIKQGKSGRIKARLAADKMDQLMN